MEALNPVTDMDAFEWGSQMNKGEFSVLPLLAQDELNRMRYLKDAISNISLNTLETDELLALTEVVVNELKGTQSTMAELFVCINKISRAKNFSSSLALLLISSILEYLSLDNQPRDTRTAFYECFNHLLALCNNEIAANIPEFYPKLVTIITGERDVVCLSYQFKRFADFIGLFPIPTQHKDIVWEHLVSYFPIECQYIAGQSDVSKALANDLIVAMCVNQDFRESVRDLSLEIYRTNQASVQQQCLLLLSEWIHMYDPPNALKQFAKIWPEFFKEIISDIQKGDLLESVKSTIRSICAYICLDLNQFAEDEVPDPFRVMLSGCENLYCANEALLLEVVSVASHATVQCSIVSAPILLQKYSQAFEHCNQKEQIVDAFNRFLCLFTVLATDNEICEMHPNPSFLKSVIHTNQSTVLRIISNQKSPIANQLPYWNILKVSVRHFQPEHITNIFEIVLMSFDCDDQKFDPKSMADTLIEVNKYFPVELKTFINKTIDQRFTDCTSNRCWSKSSACVMISSLAIESFAYVFEICLKYIIERLSQSLAPDEAILFLYALDQFNEALSDNALISNVFQHILEWHNKFRVAFLSSVTEVDKKLELCTQIYKKMLIKLIAAGEFQEAFMMCINEVNIKTPIGFYIISELMDFNGNPAHLDKYVECVEASLLVDDKAKRLTCNKMLCKMANNLDHAETKLPERIVELAYSAGQTGNNDTVDILGWFTLGLVYNGHPYADTAFKKLSTLMTFDSYTQTSCDVITLLSQYDSNQFINVASKFTKQRALSTLLANLMRVDGNATKPAVRFIILAVATSFSQPAAIVSMDNIGSVLFTTMRLSVPRASSMCIKLVDKLIDLKDPFILDRISSVIEGFTIMVGLQTSSSEIRYDAINCIAKLLSLSLSIITPHKNSMKIMLKMLQNDKIRKVRQQASLVMNQLYMIDADL